MEDGEIVKVTGALQDITDRKETEEELRESEERFRSLTEQTSDIITRHADDGTYLYVSPSVERILDYTPDDLVGRDPYDFIHPDDVDPVRDHHASILQGEPARMEFRHVHAEGHVVWVEAIGRLIPDEEGAPEAVISTRPIDERKKTEEKLRKSRERWRHLVENQRDAIHITVDGIVQFVNSAGVELVGADSKEEVVGHPLARFLTSEADQAVVAERIREVRQGDPAPLREYEIERLDGERRIVEAYAVSIEYEGEPAVQGMIRDVTERKRAQKQLQQAQKMDTVGALAGGIAHDFNNILHSVTAYVEMVREDLPADDPDRMLLQQATQGLDRAGTLVQKLLTFSRREPSERREQVDVGTIVRESLDLVRPSLPESVTVRMDIEPESTIVGDPGEVHQVATNMLTNAGQAMNGYESEDEHVLDVEVRSMDVDEDLARRHLNLEPGRYVRLSISDTGPGMTAQTKEHIFEPFFTTKAVGEGTGLGLSVVHGIVQTYDGEIVVYSEPGEGTTFDVYLPYDTETEASSRTAPTPDETEADAHILFVDDDEHIAELEAVRLWRLGYEVTTCGSAAEALQAFEDASGAFDVVVTDFAMPEMDGLDLTRSLRAHGYERPVVLMSGFSAQVSREEVEDAGITTFLRKPVGGEELNETLVRLLG